MKYFVLFFLFVSSFWDATGQDLAALDKKMGFNKFKLESSFQHYADDLGYRMSGPNGDKYYKYTKNDINQIFNISIKEINIGFYKNKLYTISIAFGEITDKDSKDVLAKLIELFGIPKKADGDDPNSSYDWQFQWNSKKVFMGFTKYSCLYKGDNACKVELFLNSKEIQTQITNDQF